MADNKEENLEFAEKRAGTAPDENSQRSSSAHNRHSLTKDLRCRSNQFDADSLDGDHPYEHEGRDSTGSSGNGVGLVKDLDRAKLVRDRQNEERQRKLEELRQQALAAQRFREQREEERRRRIEELRSRDYDRRSQVEERKRLIWEAERERREAILRKNQEREARIEAKRKNERSHIVFAFGSSTPRMLEPADTGGASFWGTRRATSTTNVMTFSAAQPLTRRSSERELDGSKKRATSAGGLDRKPGEGEDMVVMGAGTPSSGISCVARFANRRRTDLMPTIPSPRDRDGGANPPMSGRSSSAKSFTRSPGIRSGEATPNSPSRPHSSMSQQSATSSVASSSVNLRPRTGTPRRPRPASIAGTGVTVTAERNNTSNDSKVQKDSKPPLPKVHNTTKKSLSVSTPFTTKISSAERKSGFDKSATATRSTRSSPRVTPRVTPLQSPGVDQPTLVALDIKEYKHKLEDKDVKEASDEKTQIIQDNVVTELILNEANIEKNLMREVISAVSDAATPISVPKSANEEHNVLIDLQTVIPAVHQIPSADNIEKNDDLKVEKKSPESEVKNEGDLEEQCDMTASMIQKIRITTEEEAKAALAERRRLAREQAEREAELERQRLEEEARLEAERLQAEEEEQRRLEEETLRLAKEAREAEEQRLQLAIEEAKKREEEDRKRREEEARQKLEKEEAERKAREEAEKQRLEMVERLKKEEEERNARRKRVEAIMSRTRAKYQPNVSKGEGNDGEKSKEDSPSDENKPGPGEKVPQDLMTTSLISEVTQRFISGEQLAHRVASNNADEANNGVIRNGTHANGINDSSMKPILDNEENNQQELNGLHNITNHGNGIDGQTNALDNATVKQNNVTNNRLDLSEFDTLSNSNSGPILLMQSSGIGLTGDGGLANEDSLNSNLNPTAMPFTPSFGIPNTTNTFQDAFTNNKQQENPVPDLLS